MKIVVYSAEEDLDNFKIALADIEGLAYKCGYELQVSSGYKFKLICKKDIDIMPEFVLKYNKDDEGYHYSVNLKFPDIDTTSIRVTYILNQWSALSNLINAINDFVYLT